jgi:hypothetical protein
MEGTAPDWAPDLVNTEPIKRSVRAAMRAGRALLIDGSTDRAFGAVARPWIEQVDLVDVDEVAIGMLIRPDGYLAWSVDVASRGSLDTLAAALIRWFGPAHPPTR